MAEKLFQPLQLGRLHLHNRVVMAPMTRSRAQADGCASEMMVDYYRQRAGAGLIITEGTQPSANGQGYCRTPGIHTAEQVASWRPVVEAVHKVDGKIVMQIMHCGRIAHPDNKAADAETVAPSAIAAAGDMYTETGMKSLVRPRALALAEIAEVQQEYVRATQNAYAAGFDGVELHCTSGYLPAQFLSTGTNQRQDAYGGSLQNRLRFVLETLALMAAVDGADRVGIRICPGNPFNDLHDDNPAETFTALLQQISPMNLAYLHAIKSPHTDIDMLQMAATHFTGPLIINDGFDQHSAEQVLAEGTAQAVSFARLFIANPDLVARFQQRAPLAQFDPKRLYTPDRQGYCDYPSLIDPS